MLYLQNKEFNVFALYVAHPNLFSRIKSDIKYLNSRGIKNIKIKTFQGIFNGKSYPSSFLSEEKDFLKSIGTDEFEFRILNKSQNYHGNLCLSGQKFFVMDRQGNLRRCNSTLRYYGNLFEKIIKYDIKPKPCPTTNCGCPYDGILYSLTAKGNFISVLKEECSEKLYKSNPQKYKSNKFLKLVMMVCIETITNILSKKYVVYKFWQLIGSFKKAWAPISKIKK